MLASRLLESRLRQVRRVHLTRRELAWNESIRKEDKRQFNPLTE
jgi:hypothetical protein